MAMPTCMGACELETFPYETKNRAIYTQGFFLCQSCKKGIKTDDIKCPCCNTDLRRRPRHGKHHRAIINKIKRY